MSSIALVGALICNPTVEGESRLFAPPPEPLRVAGDPVPAPALVEPGPAPVELAPVSSELRLDAGASEPRPQTGTGLLALGGISLAVSGTMGMTALAGPGWADLSRREAAIVGGLSLPVALAGLGMVVGGVKTNQKFRRWAERSRQSPPPPGNGLLVVGVAVSGLGLAGIAAGTQAALAGPAPDREAWIGVGLSAGVTAIGLTLVTGGMLRRAKFSAWARGHALSPGPLALRGGGGVTLGGRF